MRYNFENAQMQTTCRPEHLNQKAYKTTLLSKVDVSTAWCNNPNIPPCKGACPFVVRVIRNGMSRIQWYKDTFTMAWFQNTNNSNIVRCASAQGYGYQLASIEFTFSF